jgi:glycyl-tRNA synthetase (class II)
LEDGTVTIRHRDNMQQERVDATSVPVIMRDLLRAPRID